MRLPLTVRASLMIVRMFLEDEIRESKETKNLKKQIELSTQLSDLKEWERNLKKNTNIVIKVPKLKIIRTVSPEHR